MTTVYILHKINRDYDNHNNDTRETVGVFSTYEKAKAKAIWFDKSESSDALVLMAGDLYPHEIEIYDVDEFETKNRYYYTV